MLLDLSCILVLIFASVAFLNATNWCLVFLDLEQSRENVNTTINDTVSSPPDALQ